MSAGTCNSCGSQCQGQYCQVCGPFERNDHLELNTEESDDEAFLDWAGPHLCDLCSTIFQTRDALLNHDCEPNEEPPSAAIPDQGGHQ